MYIITLSSFLFQYQFFVSLSDIYVFYNVSLSFYLSELSYEIEFQSPFQPDGIKNETKKFIESHLLKILLKILQNKLPKNIN